MLRLSNDLLPGNPKKHFCVIKLKMCDEREIVKNEIFLDCQPVNLSFDLVVAHFFYRLVEI